MSAVAGRDSGAAHARVDAGWGGLVVVGMPLAVPLAALREVLPAQGLVPLPCGEPAVVGGLDLRGVTVPVVDLARLLPGLPAAAPPPHPVVVLVEHRGGLLGLRADAVCGIFAAAAPLSRVRAAVAEGELAPPPARLDLYAGSVRRGDTGAIVQRLSIEALAAWPGLPWIDDPEPQRSREADLADDADATGGNDPQADGTDAAGRSWLLVRCGRLGLAVEALEVRATLWEPAIEPSPVAGGCCRGVLAFGARRVPAVDLAMLCGLGEQPLQALRQAFVIERPEGCVALLVQGVQDIVRVRAGDVAALAAGALPGGLCAGVLSRPAGDCATWMLIDGAALREHPEVRALATVNVVDPGAAPDRTGNAAPDRAGVAAPGARAAAGGESVITFRLLLELAARIAQVREILPSAADDGAFGPDAVLRSIQVVRGRSVPVLCLARLLGTAAPAWNAAGAVLVVEVDGGWVGLAVPQMLSIEQAHGNRPVPQTLAQGADATMVAASRLVTLGQGAGERTLPLLDLVALASRAAATLLAQAA